MQVSGFLQSGVGFGAEGFGLFTLADVHSSLWGQVPCMHSLGDFTQLRPLILLWGVI